MRFDVVDLAWQVFSSEGNLIGLVGMLIRPESFLSTIIAPEVHGFPIDVWVMQTDGRILYDPDVEEIGRNLFEDPLYQPFTQLLSLGKKIAVESSGSGHYEFFGCGLIKEVKKKASWVTVGLHGTEWRLVLIQVVVGDSSAAKRGPPELGLTSEDEALRRLAQDPNLLQAIVAGDKETCMSIFRHYYEDYPGIYSIQWADASGINRFGYPEENSLTDYDFSCSKNACKRRIPRCYRSPGGGILCLPSCGRKYSQMLLRSSVCRRAVSWDFVHVIFDTGKCGLPIINSMRNTSPLHLTSLLTGCRAFAVRTKRPALRYIRR